jgi:AraC family transcriptional regulator of arabinose operon
MGTQADRHLYLPASDRSFWKSSEDSDGSLRYLAWGRRNFDQQPIPESCHDGWVCAMIEEGSPTLRAASVSRCLTPGALALIGPDCAFGWKPSGTGSCRILLWMWSGFTDPALTGEPHSGFLIRMLDRAGRKSFRLLHDLCRLEVLRNEPSAGYLEGCRMMFEETIRREVLQFGIAGLPISELCGQAHAWMADHLDSSEPVARLCDFLNVSQSTLYRRFMEEVGTSPLARFQDLRMRESKRLLSEQNMSVKEVAFRMGYTHFNDFSRAYRKHFGKCPTGDR